MAEKAAADWLGQAVKLVIGVRAAALLLTVFYLPDVKKPDLLAAAIVLAAVASYVPLRYWDRVGATLVRHPRWLAAEIVLATLILVLTGVESPFYSYTLGTALLGGLLYSWPGAAIFSPMLAGIYYWTITVRNGLGEHIPHSFQLHVGLPALYLIAGAGGAVARGLLDRIQEAEAQISEQERGVAAERERGRLARDMHDSLAKTVHGIGLNALGLSRRIERNPSAAALDARQLAQDAQRAALQARDLIAGLRARREDEEPGDIESETARWSAESGIPVGVSAEPVPELAPVAARELRWILRESLRNVSRHGTGATQVAVRLRSLGGRVVMSVTDDGPGFEVPDDLTELQAGRHYGLVGMRERAQVAGGDLLVESAPGEGCTISAWVPCAAPEVPVAAEPTRSVPGHTWQ